MRKLLFLLIVFIAYGCSTDEPPKEAAEFSLDNLHADYEKIWQFEAIYNEDQTENLIEAYNRDDAILFSKDGKGIYLHGETKSDDNRNPVQGDYFTWEKAGKGIRIMGLTKDSRLMNNGLLVFDVLTEDEISYTLNIDVFGEESEIRHIEMTKMAARMDNPSDTMINLTNGLVKAWKIMEKKVNGDEVVVDAWLEDNTLIMLHNGSGIYVKGETYQMKSDTTTNDYFKWAFAADNSKILINQAEHRGIYDIEGWTIEKLTASEFTTSMYKNESGDSVWIRRVPYTE